MTNLTAMKRDQLMTSLREVGVDIWRDGEQLRYRAAAGALKPELRQKLLDWKSEIIEFLKSSEASEQQPPLRTVPRDRDLPLSFAQQRLWFLDQFEPNSAVYNVPMGLRLTGALDASVLRACLSEVLRRHEALRTCFKTVNGEPVQTIQPAALMEMPLVDVEGLPEPERERTALRLCAEEAQRPFDLTRDVLLRTKLLRLGEADHILLLTMHHIASDGWSLGVLSRELSELYAAFVDGKPSPLPELPVQYADFAAWQRDWLQEKVLEKQLDYWRKQLEGAPAVLELPTDHPRPAVQSYRGALMTGELPKPLSSALKKLSRAEGATLFMTLLAAFQTLLHRYSGSDHIVVGSPIAGRQRPELESLIGFFVNTLVMRGDLSGDPSFRTLLAQTCEVALGAYAHQDLPFEKLVEELHPDRSMGHAPIFQLAFALQNASEEEAPALPGLEVAAFPIEVGVSKFDLTFHVWERDQRLEIMVVYCTDLFDAETIRRMLTHYQTLLEGIVADPDRRLSDLPLLTEAERNQILYEWNDTQANFPADKCVHELFEEQVARAPDAIAVMQEDRQLTYGELNARANRLARHLYELGVAPDTRVAIGLERSIELVIAELAILKCGAAYVPLDQNVPIERLSFMIEDSQARVVVTAKGRVVPEMSGVRRLDVEELTFTGEISYARAAPEDSEATAYVMYTSGSTGKPKGVEIPHRAIGRLVLNNGYADFQASDRIALASNPTFDAATMEVWGALLNGGRIVVIDQAALLEPSGFARVLETYGVTTLFITTALFNRYAVMIPEAFARLRFLLSGGEQSEPHSFARLLQHAGPEHLIHCYGPTETTTFAATYEVKEVPPRAKSIPIGGPISNTQIYILDRQGEPVPIGVVGEIHIGGAGVARGYLNRQELTADRFVVDPFAKRAEAQMYKTGDLGRHLPDGNIEFVGRNDFQVKIRGFRIELGEIEARLAEHPEVREAVVLAREDSPGEKRLVAYFTAAEDIPAGTLRAHLERALPEYMVPAAYVRLGALPLTPNGKLDRRALPAPGDHAFGVRAYEAPEGPIETAIAAIWAEFLHLERVGRRDDFFNLGGHSLMALRVIGEINTALKARLHVPAFFQNPSIERLAKVVEQRHQVGPEPQVVRVQAGHTGLPVYFLGARPEDYRLAQSLGEDRATFAVDVPMPVDRLAAIATPDRSVLPTIEQLGARYADAVRAHAGSSPCVLAGYSLGGKIAFEAAHALRRAGGDVGLVLLVDAWAFTWSGATRGPTWQSLRWIWQGAASGTYSDPRYLARLSASLADSWRLALWLCARVPKMLKGRLQSVKNRLSPEAGPSGYLDWHSLPIDQRAIDRLAYIAGRTWRPRPLDALGVLFRTKAPNEELLPGYDFTNGWGGLFDRGLEIVQVEGDHWSMVGNENIAGLAWQINSVLDRYETEHNVRVVRSADETDAGRSAGQLGSDRELAQTEDAGIYASL